MKNSDVLLKRFEVEGFRGFKDRLVFDLEARDYAFNSNLIRGGLVKHALVYGPNGVGKTSLGLALFDVVSHLTDKKPLNKEFTTGYLNLGLTVDSAVRFRFVFSVNGESVEYEYSKNVRGELLSERLVDKTGLLIDWDYFDPAKCRVPSLSALSLKVDLPDNKLSILKYICRNLPTGSIPSLEAILDFADNMLWFRSLGHNTYAGYTNGASSISSVICQMGKLGDFQNFLCENGLNYTLVSREDEGKTNIYIHNPLTGRELEFADIVSSGTLSLCLFYYWSITAFDKISFLFIDEFDAYYHYQTAASVVKRLNAAPFQSILTSHNTYLMQNRYTRPDCCYLMSPGEIRNLPDCTDREIREAHNLEKLYQNGAFTV